MSRPSIIFFQPKKIKAAIREPTKGFRALLTYTDDDTFGVVVLKEAPNIFGSMIIAKDRAGLRVF